MKGFPDMTSAQKQVETRRVTVGIQNYSAVLKYSPLLVFMCQQKQDMFDKYKPQLQKKKEKQNFNHFTFITINQKQNKTWTPLLLVLFHHVVQRPGRAFKFHLFQRLPS